MRAATTTATAVVRRELTSSPMTSARRVSSTSGTSANGMPKDSTTWDTTSAQVGSTPRARTDQRGDHGERPADEQRDPAAQEALP